MIVSLIVAVGRRNEIGKGGKMPWHLPADLKHFKRNTLGKPVLMGRKTLTAIGRPLPERRNLVLTRDAAFQADGCETVTSLEGAIARVGAAPELMVIGGGEVYRLAWERADRIYLTCIQADVDGADTFFPDMEEGRWREVSRDDHRADVRNPFDYSFLVLERVR
ncbi:MAG TPA: dihydrofolate reductase [Gammaproteobacteria bacterium]|jgi:dihydrofolate reductase|nr:dihydrofolate reductase [Gammaproteobacteria bacterium]